MNGWFKCWVCVLDCAVLVALWFLLVFIVCVFRVLLLNVVIVYLWGVCFEFDALLCRLVVWICWLLINFVEGWLIIAWGFCFECYIIVCLKLLCCCWILCFVGLLGCGYLIGLIVLLRFWLVVWFCLFEMWFGFVECVGVWVCVRWFSLRLGVLAVLLGYLSFDGSWWFSLFAWVTYMISFWLFEVMMGCVDKVFGWICGLRFELLFVLFLRSFALFGCWRVFIDCVVRFVVCLTLWFIYYVGLCWLFC